MNSIKDIVIVGGGTAGLIAALYIKKYYPQFNVKIVKSKIVGIIGVGEGSTEHFAKFIKEVGINHLELISETNATIKSGILFDKWSTPTSSYLHSIQGTEDSPLTSFDGNIEIYNRLILNRPNDPYPLAPGFKDINYKNRVTLTDDLNYYLQYHFDTLKLNNFLLKKCKERNIIVSECYVEDLTLDSKGNIKSLITKKEKKIQGDLFIDCTGFKKVLSSKLNSKWISYSHYLPVNEAITLPSELNTKNEIEPYTKSTAMDYGWAWKIPTQTRYSNGYVFNNNYTNSDNALNEFNKHLNLNAKKSIKNIKFDVGRINKFWVKNCVSIGLSGSFVEPLEAQSIGFSIIQSQLLISYISSWIQNKSLISSQYNNTLTQVFDNMVDYVQLHYLTQRSDTKFWKEKPFQLTSFNKLTYPLFSLGIFNNNFFTNPYLMFNGLNFYQVYYGIKLLKKQKIQDFQNSKHSNYIKEWDNYYNNLHPSSNYTTIPHTDYLKLIRENYSS